MNWSSLFALSFSVSALAAIAELLRSKRELTRRVFWTTILNGGMMGTMIAMLWYSQFPGNPALLIGLCILFGLGGVPIIDFILFVIRKGGIDIRIDFNQKTEGKDNDLPKS